MANKPFDRNVINTRERPLSSDINQAQSEIDYSIREVLDRLCLSRVSVLDDRSTAPFTGFIGEALRVRPLSPLGLQVQLSSGLGFFYDAAAATAIGGVPNVDDLSRFKPLPLNSVVPIAVPAPDPTNPRIDIVEVRPNRRLLDTASRDVLNTATGQFDPTSIFKTLGWDLESSVGTVVTPANSATAIGYKAGTPAAVPTAPPTSPGYVKIAEILVGAGVTTIDYNVIKDLRRLLYPLNGVQVRVRVSQPTSVALAPTISDVVAPPGVIVVALGVSFTNAECHLYIFPGEPATGSLPITSLTAGGGQFNTALGVSGSLFAITPTEQTALAGADASSPTAVAVGQNCYRVILKANSPANPMIYEASVGFHGGL